MKSHCLCSGLVIVSLAVGCDQTKPAAEKAATQASAAVEQANKQASAAVEQAGKKAKAAVEQAGKDVKAAVQSAGEQAKAAVASAAAEAANLKVGDIDLGKDLTALIDKLKGTLNEVKDVSSAKAALPQLEQANLGLDKFVGLVDQLPAAAKPALASLIKTHSATITETVKKVAGMAGVGEILKPVLDQIVAKLSKVSGSEAAPAPK